MAKRQVDDIGVRFSDVGAPGFRWIKPSLPLAPPLTALCSIKRRTGAVVRHLGTGVLVGPRIIVTAAHVADFGQPRRREGDYWLVQPAGLGAVFALHRRTDLGNSAIAAAAFPVERPQTGSQNDIALLLLTGEAPAAMGRLVPGEAGAGLIDVRVAGYPILSSLRPPAKGNDIFVGRGPGRIDPQAPWRLVYEVDIEGGHSGGPVFAEGVYAGVHVADALLTGGGLNSGVRFTHPIISWLTHVSNDLTA